MKFSAAVLAMLAGLSLPVTSESTDRKFEVASIKPNKSGSNRVNLNPLPGGRFTAVNVTVMDLVAAAYGSGMPFPRSNILNGPAWMTRDRFDIVAKAEGNPTLDEVALMLRPLLAERFSLSSHPETRERPIYTLTFARSDQALGLGLKPASRDCLGPRELNEPAPAGCEMVSVPGIFRAHGRPIAAFARLLSSWVEDHREVRDQTALTGAFDFDLHWTPDRMPVVPADASPELAQALRSVDTGGPSLFTAVQEQLGLKLVPGKDQTRVLVVDHVEQPSPD
jgi:bla regulator protein blaR1